MPLADERFSLSKIENLTYFALFSVFATGIHAVESLFTLPIPWLRLGLVHIVTLLMLPFYGFRFIFGIFLIRVFVGSAIVGKLFSPGFILAFGGGAMATVVMIASYKFAGHYLSLWGISLLGAWTHNLVQVFLAAWIIEQRSTLFLLPYFLGAALITGSINGVLANKLSSWSWA